MTAPRDIVLVTGSSGFIGSALIQHLAERFRLVGFDEGTPPFPPAEAECVCLDLTSERSVQAGLERVRYGYGNRIASVIHLAAYYDFSGEPSPKYEEVTVRGTERLLRQLRALRSGSSSSPARCWCTRRRSREAVSPRTRRSGRPGSTPNRRSRPSK